MSKNYIVLSEYHFNVETLEFHKVDEFKKLEKGIGLFSPKAERVVNSMVVSDAFELLDWVKAQDEKVIDRIWSLIKN